MVQNNPIRVAGLPGLLLLLDETLDYQTFPDSHDLVRRYWRGCSLVSHLARCSRTNPQRQPTILREMMRERLLQFLELRQSVGRILITRWAFYDPDGERSVQFDPEDLSPFGILCQMRRRRRTRERSAAKQQCREAAEDRTGYVCPSEIHVLDSISTAEPAPGATGCSGQCRRTPPNRVFGGLRPGPPGQR